MKNKELISCIIDELKYKIIYTSGEISDMLTCYSETISIDKFEEISNKQKEVEYMKLLLRIYKDIYKEEK